MIGETLTLDSRVRVQPGTKHDRRARAPNFVSFLSRPHLFVNTTLLSVYKLLLYLS